MSVLVYLQKGSYNVHQNLKEPMITKCFKEYSVSWGADFDTDTELVEAPYARECSRTHWEAWRWGLAASPDPLVCSGFLQPRT